MFNLAQSYLYYLPHRFPTNYKGEKIIVGKWHTPPYPRGQSLQHPERGQLTSHAS